MYYNVSSNLPEEIMKKGNHRKLCARCKGKGVLVWNDLPENQRQYSRNVDGEIIEYTVKSEFSCSQCDGEGSFH